MNEKTGVHQFAELEFSEEGHVYRLNGEIIPSVTTVMKPVSSSVYGGIDTAVLNMAASRGSAVHEAIENYVLYGIEDIVREYAGYLEAFTAFWAKYKPELIAVEVCVYHKYRKYAGTVDLLLRIAGETWLIDNKTSSKVEKMLTRLQLEAYEKALASHGIKVDRKGILHLQRTGRYKLVEHEMNDNTAWNTFLAAHAVHDYIKNGGKL